MGVVIVVIIIIVRMQQVELMNSVVVKRLCRPTSGVAAQQAIASELRI